VVNARSLCDSGASVPIPLLESAVYPFESLLPELESPPIAARRALDHAGLRLSVEAWRSLGPEGRQRITVAGVSERVDADAVTALLRRASPAPQKVAAATDPDPSTPPEALARALEPSRSIDPRRWSRLRAVDRYALAHTYRRAVARSAFSILVEAYDAIQVVSAAAQEGRAGGHRPSSAPPSSLPSITTSGVPSGMTGGAYQPAGYYSSLDTPPDPRPAVPRIRSANETPTQPRGAVIAEADSGGRATRSRASIVPASAPSGASERLSNHLNEAGEVHMVDVARKPVTERRAVARGSVLMRAETLARLAEHDVPKGEVLGTARLAAIMAAKRAHELIPLCHPVALTHVDVLLEVDDAASAVHVFVTVDALDRTGCEMEALVAASTACLTVYDMLKGLDRDMVITDVLLLEKSGGRSGHYLRGEAAPDKHESSPPARRRASTDPRP
jgi:cyclic pyranopterin phosphate synthase